MANSEVTNSQDPSFLVKDVDGQFKVWQHGTMSAAAASPVALPVAPITPNFQQPATPAVDSHFLPATTSGQPHEVAEFHFHPDDKADLEAEMAKINSYLSAAAEKRKYSIEKIVAKLIEKNKLKLSPEQEGKFVSLLLSFFRQVRSLVITKELLIQDFSFDPSLADKVMVIVKSLKDKIEAADGVVIRGSNERTVDAIDEVPTAMPELIIAPQRPAEPVPEKPAMTIKPVAPVAPRVETPVFNDSALPKVRRPVTIEPVKVSAPIRAARPAKVMSRIDELAAMTVEEFRQLDADPRVRAAKVLQRINNLAKESLARKAQGMAAWRTSQVYQTYLTMGHHGLEHSRNLSQIVQELQQENKPYLTAEEFEAMTDLNKQLRF